MAKIRRQNAPRRLQDAHKTAQEALKPPPGRPPDAPRCLQDAPKTPQDDPKPLQDAPKMAPRRSQDALRTAQDAPRRPKPLQDPSKTLPSHPKPPPDNDFGMILGSLWKIFGRFFGRNCRPTCLLELTVQKSNYLKRNENFPKEHIQIIIHTGARCGRCRRQLDINNHETARPQMKGILSTGNIHQLWPC